MAKKGWKRRRRFHSLNPQPEGSTMSARMFAALPFALAIGLFACTPALAQDAMPASSSSSMSHDSMHRQGASMQKHGMMMKKNAMQGDAMQHKAMHHDTMMKHGDSMKMKQDESAPASSGG
jgi:hypothetical protein